MLIDRLEAVVSIIEPVLVKEGFLKKNEFKFIRKNKDDYHREELFSFTARAHRSDPNSIYISCTIGLYYPDVRKIEKQIIEDHITKYPIISGSISHFSDKKEFLSILYIPGENDKQVSCEIEKEILDGGLHLINTFPTLESILSGIKTKNPYLSDYYQVYNERNLITVASIIFALEGKERSVEWTKENFDAGARKNEILKIINKI